MHRGSFLQARRSFLLGALVLLAPPLSWCQAGTSHSPTLLIAARAKAGSPTEISAQDLAMKLDGKPASIQEVHYVVGEALRYCILVDNSGSQRSTLHLQREEATELLTKIVQPGRDRGMLVNFSDQAFVDADSANPQDLVKALDKSTARGGTALYDALFACAETLSNPTTNPGTAPVLRLIFVLSDGEDNSSHVTRDAAIQAAMKDEIKIYSFGQKNADPNSPRGSARAKDTLREFAKMTGGKTYFPGKESEVPGIVTDISQELASMFLITYSAQTHDSQPHKLEIESAAKAVSITAPDHCYVPTP